MTRLITSGFEVYVSPITASDSGAFTEDGCPDGRESPATWTGSTRATSGQRSGAAALRVVEASATAPNHAWRFTGVIDRTYFFRIYMRIVTLRASNQDLIVGSVPGALGGTVKLGTDGTVFGPDNVKSAALNDGAYHRLEYSWRSSATQANRTWALRVDGTPVSSGSAQSTDQSAPSGVGLSFLGATGGQFYFDDAALNDDQGAAPHNTWPGDGYVICLLPTADNSRGSWTGGAGGTTSLFDALNNTPPAGAVTPGTNTSQITANAVATTGLFDTQTYLAAGATVGSTAVGCSVVACTGEPVATGTKSGHADTVNTVNNTPTAATATLAAGLDAGAEAAWPILWRWWASPFAAYSSQPTLSSGARLGITTTTATRAADACFLGLIVELQPAAAPPAAKKPRVISTSVPAMRAALR